MAAAGVEELTRLQEDTDGFYYNHKVSVITKPNGTITFPYKLEKGITDQAIALDLLKAEGFDSYILEKANTMFNALVGLSRSYNVAQKVCYTSSAIMPH